MDRRQKKSKKAIFNALSELVAKKDFNKITVGEIIEKADVGRATFYAHFETKDCLLKEFCRELFCHIFDSENDQNGHRHIFECSGEENAFLHVFRHLYKNDNNILALLSSQNNELFWGYFRHELKKLVQMQMYLFESHTKKGVCEDFWKEHIVSVFIETIRWWVTNGKSESPELISEYFFKVV